jgi:chloride channel protein, CIC family
MSATWKKLAEVAHQFARRHWQQVLILRDRLRMSEEAANLIVAVIVGILGGLTTWAYTGLNQLIQWAALGEPGNLLEALSSLPKWRIVLISAGGGLVAGGILYWGLRLMRNLGLSNLLEAVAVGDGRLSLRAGLVNAFSSLTSISTGASIGREGLITQISATLASKLGQWSQWPPYRLRLFVACGAASGIAAAYKAPISGAVFAAQIVLGNFSMNLFAPLVVASVTAAMVSRGFFGIEQWYVVPRFDFTRLTQLPWFVLLGVLSGVLGAAFLKALRWSETLSGKLSWPIYLRLGFAGLIVGLIGCLYPGVFGNGYEATNHLLSEAAQAPIEIQLILGLLLAKFAATVATVGMGTVGGVFTPTLFLGACLGSAFGTLLHVLNVGITLPTGAFALVGMGSMLAATTFSPLLAILMIFELSLNYSIMPPLMLACVVATLITRRLHPESIYTEPLRRKGVELERESPYVGAAMEMTVGDIMLEPVPPLNENTRFEEMADRFLNLSYNYLPVIDAKQRLLGVVALHDLKEWLNAKQELSGVIACDVMRPPLAVLMPQQKLTDALPLLLTCEVRHVPVVNNLSEYKLVGAVVRAEALGLLSEAIAARSAPKLEAG